MKNFEVEYEHHFRGKNSIVVEARDKKQAAQVAQIHIHKMPEYLAGNIKHGTNQLPLVIVIKKLQK